MPMLHEMTEEEFAERTQLIERYFDPNNVTKSWAINEIMEERKARVVRKGEELGKKVCEGKI